MDTQRTLESTEVKKVMSLARDLVQEQDHPLLDVAVESALENVSVVSRNNVSLERNPGEELKSEIQLAAGVVLGAACGLLAARAADRETMNV